MLYVGIYYANCMDEKRYIIRCGKCRWARMSNGLSSDVTELKEIKKCHNCGGPRQFRCPRCGQTAKMTRVKGE